MWFNLIYFMQSSFINMRFIQIWMKGPRCSNGRIYWCRRGIQGL
uniref:Uncharacterized protein n=1 Tax=Arundo donax TaxID=35708 RepID=A0A0A9E893_ARUDO